jgi:predicted nucleic acid-binding protein
VVIVDDFLARRTAEALHIPLTGTLGVLLSAKRAGLIAQIAPLLDHLHALQFRVSPATRAAVLKLSGES